MMVKLNFLWNVEGNRRSCRLLTKLWLIAYRRNTVFFARWTLPYFLRAFSEQRRTRGCIRSLWLEPHPPYGAKYPCLCFVSKPLLSGELLCRRKQRRKPPRRPRRKPWRKSRRLWRKPPRRKSRRRKRQPRRVVAPKSPALPKCAPSLAPAVDPMAGTPKTSVIPTRSIRLSRYDGRFVIRSKLKLYFILVLFVVNFLMFSPQRTQKIPIRIYFRSNLFYPL